VVDERQAEVSEAVDATGGMEWHVAHLIGLGLVSALMRHCLIAIVVRITPNWCVLLVEHRQPVSARRQTLSSSVALRCAMTASI
jgi:hypothetical protein